MRGHADRGSLHYRQGPGGAAERHGDADSWSTDAGVEDFVRSQLPPPPARMLEVGCGSGELALALSAGGWRVTAVDPEAPEGEPFFRAAVEELDAAEYEPFDVAVTVLSLHHTRDVGAVLDKVCSLLRPGVVLVVDEFRKEHLADEATAAFFYYQHISLLCAGRKGSGGEGQPPMGDSFESWFSRLSERRASVHGEGDILAALEERFATRSLSYGPFLFRQGLDAEVEPLERKLIEEGGILPTGLRWVGSFERRATAKAADLRSGLRVSPSGDRRFERSTEPGRQACRRGAVEVERGSADCPLLWRRRDRMQDPYAGVFVEQMLGELCRGIGIVESRRGATGG